MEKKKKLLYFTNSYPFGFGELWKTDELNVLVNYFEEITVVPFSYADNKTPVAPIKGVIYHEPLFENGVPNEKWIRQLKTIFFSKFNYLFFSEFFREKVFLSLAKARKWMSASRKMIHLYDHPVLKNLLYNVGHNTILYFYWGRGTSEVLPLLYKKKGITKVARFHRYDLYKYANKGYIPYQYYQVKNLSFAIPCSEDGRKVLANYYPQFQNKIEVKRLGTISKGKSKNSNDGIFRIVSCSSVEKVKRVDLIARTLQTLKIDIEWVHIGQGTLMNELKRITSTFPKNIKVTFLNQLPANEVISYYLNNPVDLFIHVSESEGVPVSIMEALAAGIPVLATDAGGTREIVDDCVGVLLPRDLGTKQLAEFINLFSQKKDEEISCLRSQSFNRYREKCDALELANELARFLLA